MCYTIGAIWYFTPKELIEIGISPYNNTEEWTTTQFIVCKCGTHWSGFGGECINKSYQIGMEYSMMLVDKNLGGWWNQLREAYTNSKLPRPPGDIDSRIKCLNPTPVIPRVPFNRWDLDE